MTKASQRAALARCRASAKSIPAVIQSRAPPPSRSALRLSPAAARQDPQSLHDPGRQNRSTLRNTHSVSRNTVEAEQNLASSTSRAPAPIAPDRTAVRYRTMILVSTASMPAFHLGGDRRIHFFDESSPAPRTAMNQKPPPAGFRGTPAPAATAPRRAVPPRRAACPLANRAVAGRPLAGSLVPWWRRPLSVYQPRP